MRPSKFLFSPLVLDTFWFCIDFMVDHRDPSPSTIVMLCQILYKFPMNFQCFHMSIVTRRFASLATSATRFHQHDALQAAHVRNFSLCVAFGALRFGTRIRSFCKCSKYITFSTIICTLVLQTTVCVAPRARRRSVHSRVLSDTLAASAARSRPECRHEPDLSEFEPLRPPRSTADVLEEHRRQHISTTTLVSSVVGCAMHMEWPDGIGLGSWDWENPRQESANHIPALPVLTGHAVGCPRAGGSG